MQKLVHENKFQMGNMINHITSYKEIFYKNNQVYNYRHPIFLFLFFAHAFQAYDVLTKTLTVEKISDFEDTNKYYALHVIISYEIENIIPFAFYECTSLVSAKISDSVISID